LLVGAVLAVLLGGHARAALRMEAKGADIIVRNGLCEVTISPQDGGRITSLLFDGEEMTAMLPGGGGGLMGEAHTAGVRFNVVERGADGQNAFVTLAGTAGDLRVVRRYEFTAGQAWFRVRETFENRSRFALSGDSAPRLRCAALPAGGRASGRELYCMDRGQGTEVLPAREFLSRLYAPGGQGAPLRWVAVAEPASRRALGFALEQTARRPLPPVMLEGGGLMVGWACPAIPPWHSLSTETLVVPLTGFTAVSELNARFVADSLPVKGEKGLSVRFGIASLAGRMADVSVITRTYDASGHELDPCDPLLMDALEPGKETSGVIRGAPGSQRPACILHEVYARGEKLGEFAVPVDREATGAVRVQRQAAPPDLKPLGGDGPPPPGSLIRPAPEATEFGAVIWQFDGLPATTEARRLDLVLARGETRTVFLGVRALRELRDLRLTIAGIPVSDPGLSPLPPAAAVLWQVEEATSGPAVLRPFNRADLGAGQVLWLALTADARDLKPGRYVARLVLTAGGAVRELPLSMTVSAVQAAPRDAFPLWYLGNPDGEGLPDSVLAKLADYGVGGLTVIASEKPERELREAEHWGYALVALRSPYGTLPPGGAPPGLAAIRWPRPAWLMSAEGINVGVALAAERAGYRPAFVCERLGAVRRELFRHDGVPACWLVKDGCEPRRVAALIKAGALTGRESVWLYLDLKDADWRRAAVEVRGAVWAAAWQGLAGVAVRCEPPDRRADAQLAVWHVVRDARQEAALWLTGRMTAKNAARNGSSPDALLAATLLDGLVGTDPDCGLAVRTEKRPFREVYRVGPPRGRSGVSLSQFEAARLRTIAAMEQLRGVPSGSDNGQLYWLGIPLVEDGRVRWSIVAPDAESAWKTATELKATIQAASGRSVEVRRSLPERGGRPEELPLLIWLVTDGDGREDWPDALRRALERRGDAPLIAVGLPDGPMVAAIRTSCDISALSATFSRAPLPYPPAAGVQ